METKNKITAWFEQYFGATGQKTNLVMPSVRPTTLNDVIGQAVVVEQLRVKCAAFRKRGTPLAHMLFTGSAGLGKTTLSRIVAKEIGVPFTEISGGKLRTVADVTNLAQKMRPGEIVFVDEAHTISRAAQEALLTVLESFSIGTMQTHKFTMIGATTDRGDIKGPLVARFEIIPLQPYSEVDLHAIVQAAAERAYGFRLPETTAQKIASLSRSTARTAIQLMESLVEAAEGTISGSVSTNDLTIRLLRKVLSWKKMDDYVGLDAASRRYLVALANNNGKGLGEDALCAMIGEAKSSLKNEIEPFLVSNIEFPVYKQVGSEYCQVDTIVGPMVQITRTGRVSTLITDEYLRMCRDSQKFFGYFPDERLG